MLRRIMLTKRKNEVVLPQIKTLILLFFSVLLASCATPEVRLSLPEIATKSSVPAQVRGFPRNIRFWADEAPAFLSDSLKERINDYIQSNMEYRRKNGAFPQIHFLALSGGGDGGAFGAGVLNGWTQNGSRPDFAIVTGVSTGALIAPFAFLGSKYDHHVREAYLSASPETIYLRDFFTVFDGITGGAALVDNQPLRLRVEAFLTPKLLAEIALEHRQGRRLYISTTNLEAERGVIWDIGAIANSGNPKALKLIQDILLASSAVPGLFEPGRIDVIVDGKPYQELHVDGGVTAQLVLYPLDIGQDIVDLLDKYKIKRTLHIIRNSKVSGEYEEVSADFFNITRRSILTLIKYQGIGDLFRLHYAAERDGIDYRLIHIPSSFKRTDTTEFSKEVMNALYDIGVRKGLSQTDWLTSPPGSGK